MKPERRQLWLPLICCLLSAAGCAEEEPPFDPSAVPVTEANADSTEPSASRLPPHMIGVVNRGAASWLLHLGGEIRIRILADEKERDLKSEEEIPKELFTVVKVNFKGKKAHQLDMVNLGALLSLTHLWMADSGTTDFGLTHVHSDIELVELGAQRTRVTDTGLEYIAGLPKLRILLLSGNRINGKGFVHLKGMKIQTLAVDDTDVDDAGFEQLAGLTYLEHLNAAKTKVTDAGLAHLKGLTELKTLDLTGTQVTDAGIAELKTALPKCEITK